MRTESHKVQVPKLNMPAPSPQMKHLMAAPSSGSHAFYTLGSHMRFTVFSS